MIVKQIISILILVTCCKLYSFGQETGKTDTARSISKIEVVAGFPGGEKSWTEFLKKNINYDIAIFNDAPRGKYKVGVKFTVNQDGHLSDIEALTHFGYGMEREVIHALKHSPNWLPAMQNGKYVNAYRIQNVTFAVDVL